MRIVQRTLWARVEERTDAERAFLAEYLSYDEVRYVKTGGRTKRVQPKVHRLYSLINDSFPAGMVPQVVRAAKEEGFAVDLVDARVPPFSVCGMRTALEQNEGAVLAAYRLGGADAVLAISANIPGLSNVLAAIPAEWLRPYQFKAVDRVLARTCGILWMPTGSGKTEVAVALGQCIPVRWLFLVHRKGLMAQAADRYELRTGEVAGRIGEGKWDVKRFTVATFQTLAAALRSKDPAKRTAAQQLLEGAQGLIIDEVHVLPADTFWSVSMAACNAHWRIGMSGTPLAGDDRRSLLAVAATGPVVYRLRATELVEAGILAKPEIHMLTCEQDSSKPTWQGVYGECIVRSAKRNQKTVDAALRAAKPCLVFVKELKHGKELVARLGRAGLNAEFAHGKHSVEWRNNMIHNLERGATDVLVCSVIFQEGVDIPCLASVVIASGGKSVIAALQRIGRGMRNNDGKKDTFEVYDFDDVGNKWLERHTKGRVKAYQSEGFDVEHG